MKKWIFFWGLMASGAVFAQSGATKPKMVYMGAYDSGQASVSIHKLFDPTEDVVCYLLMPDQAGRKEGVNGAWVYDGNSVGAMSCIKVRMNPPTSSPLVDRTRDKVRVGKDSYTR